MYSPCSACTRLSPWIFPTVWCWKGLDPRQVESLRFDALLRTLSRSCCAVAALVVRMTTSNESNWAWVVSE